MKRKSNPEDVESSGFKTRVRLACGKIAKSRRLYNAMGQVFPRSTPDTADGGMRTQSLQSKELGSSKFRSQRKEKNDHQMMVVFSLAAELGFEPRHTESESAVLPLHNSAILNFKSGLQPEHTEFAARGFIFGNHTCCTNRRCHILAWQYSAFAECRVCCATFTQFRYCFNARLF